MDLLNEKDLSFILRYWEERHASPSFDPCPVLMRLCELIEGEYDELMKCDPDPFDERHPSRSHPSFSYGQTLKALFRKDFFMTKLVHDYMRENYWSRLGFSNRVVRDLNILACRLMIDILPGLETAVVFDTANEQMVHRLYTWAESGGDPLQSYATGLLAAAMEVQDIANNYRENNNKLIPILLNRLEGLYEELLKEKPQISKEAESVDLKRPFANFSTSNGSLQQSDVSNGIMNDSIKSNGESNDEGEQPRKKRLVEVDGVFVTMNEPRNIINDECSNSSCSENLLLQTVPIYPPIVDTKLLYILEYLTPMGEYQEFLGHLVEKNALSLALKLIDRENLRSVQVAFAALRYIASILCHKKFAIELVNKQGLQKMVAIPRPGVGATGVSICLFYLSHVEDAMERICLLPSYIIAQLINYALLLLECNHESARCHATMFFGLAFQFSVLLKEFDAQDGLRRLFNVLTTLPILSSDAPMNNDEEECTTRQIVRHVCTALKRYLEAHCCIKADAIQTAFCRDSSAVTSVHSSLPAYKARKYTPELIREYINMILEYLIMKGNWKPIEQLMNLGGITTMLKIIALTYEWNYSGRAETVKSALDVIGICAVSGKVQRQLCERMRIVEDNNMTGIQTLLSAAESEIVADPEVQKSALNVLITCACAPLYKEGDSIRFFRQGRTFRRRSFNRFHSFEEILTKVWDCIRTSNGIMVLMSLITTKTPVTEADAIRALACQALAGLARCDTVQQIISKLPLFTTGLLQNMMNEPILAEKRQEHVMFQKYALQLLERVCGTAKTNGEFEQSLATMHKANVVAQTRIQYNDKQLFQVIRDHLWKHGMLDTVNALEKEANLTPIKQLPSTVGSLSPYTCTLTRRLSNTINSQEMKQIKHTSSFLNNDSSPACSPNPIKFHLTKQRDFNKSSLESPSRSLQRQTKKEINVVADINKILSNTPISLDYMVREYLANQHSNCKHPMVTCPPFDLLRPHRCPDPKPKSRKFNNCAIRFSRGIPATFLDEHLVHSKFCPVKTFRLNEEEGYFTCLEFLNDKQIAVGTYQGDLKILNIYEGIEVHSFACHESYLVDMAKNSNGKLLITSSTWRKPLSTLWQLNDTLCVPLFHFDDDEVMEFSNLTDDKLIGTKGESAQIYDVTTGQRMLSLTPRDSNHYTKNKATFNPVDELVLSDGVLWDINSGKEIHKFDKLNQTLSGVFHPNGLEVVSNTEVWDLRTFHLIKTVPALDQCTLTFPKTSRVIYAVPMERDMEEDVGYDTSFKTLDSRDYTSISTIDVKRPIYNLACNKSDTQIALVENWGEYENIDESMVRLYDVGRVKEEDYADSEEDDDTSSEDGSGSEADPNGPMIMADFNDDDQSSDEDDDFDDGYDPYHSSSSDDDD